MLLTKEQVVALGTDINFRFGRGLEIAGPKHITLGDLHDTLVAALNAAREPQAGEHLREAVRRLYYAAVWHADRSVDEQKLWTDVRDAAGFEPGNSPQPQASARAERKALRLDPHPERKGLRKLVANLKGNEYVNVSAAELRSLLAARTLEPAPAMHVHRWVGGGDYGGYIGPDICADCGIEFDADELPATPGEREPQR